MAEQQELLNDFNELRRLYKQLKFTDSTGVDSPFADILSPSSDLPSNNFGLKINQFGRKISKYNEKGILERVWNLFKKLDGKEKQLPTDIKEMVITIRASKSIFNQKINITIEPNSENQPVIQSILPQTSTAVVNNPTPKHTIQEILDAMLLKAHNKPATENRKRNIIIKLLKDAHMSLKDDYSKLHDTKIINQMSKNVLNMNLENGGQNLRIACIKELVTCACNMEPDFYSTKVIANLPHVPKTNFSSNQGHKSYSDAQLLDIFNPKHSYFQKDPDCFWICMISLFTGARANAAITLQYQDIIKENDLDCIYFHAQKNDKVKQLKNRASIRKVPIHNQLLDLGFVDYVNRKKAKLKASDTDYIFDDAIHKKSQTYNNNYITRHLTPFLKEIGAKQNEYDGYDFHSFRQTVSHKLQETHIPHTYINSIIGWEGRSTMEQSYSRYSLDQIKAQLDTFEYDFLKPHFAEWKTIMAEKP